jgi:hypothetical protein
MKFVSLKGIFSQDIFSISFYYLCIFFFFDFMGFNYKSLIAFSMFNGAFFIL